MIRRVLGIYCLCGLLALTVNAEIKFATAIIPPYQYLDNKGELSGLAIPLIECIMKDMGRTHRITVYPWLRAQKSVEAGDNDAFFVASENAQRSQYAQISAPLFDGKRSWHIRPDFHLRPGTQEFSDTAFVGGIQGTNMHTWLVENFKHVVAKKDEKELIKLIIAKRVDAILLTDIMFDTVAEKMLLPKDAFLKAQASQHPLGAYFGHHFLKENDGFLDRFNQSITRCK